MYFIPAAGENQSRPLAGGANFESKMGLIPRRSPVDPLQKTGGIVQGMSGSPIIQDGKLIGAVTHVFVNDPTRGYGLFMDWML